LYNKPFENISIF